MLPDFLSAADREQLAELAVCGRARWEAGRQDSGYAKLDLGADDAEGALRALTLRSLAALGEPEPGRWDRYLLRYGVGASIPPHTDPPLGAALAHVRLNAIVTPPRAGGALRLGGQDIALAVGDAVLFRPDAVEHEVTPVTAGERLVWSVGCNVPVERSAPSSGAQGPSPAPTVASVPPGAALRCSR